MIETRIFCFLATIMCTALWGTELQAQDDSMPLVPVASPCAEGELIHVLPGSSTDRAYVESGYAGMGETQVLTEAMAAEQGLTPADEILRLPGIETCGGGLTPESVCLTDERIQVTDTTAYPWRASCKLVITMPDGVKYVGTGFFIGPGTVLTAGHVVHEGGSGGKWARKIEVIPGMNGDSRPYGTAVSRNFRSLAGWTVKGKPTHDLGAIILPRANLLGHRTGWFGFAAYRKSELSSMAVNVAGYPADKSFGTQWLGGDPLSIVGKRRLFYYIDTYGGQSGACVWQYDGENRYAVAVHGYGGCPNAATRITQYRFDLLKQWKALRQ